MPDIYHWSAKIAPHCDRIITSIFVNPAQFSANEDLGTYPRDEAADLEALETTKTDYVFTPSAEEMYPSGFTPDVLLQGLAAKRRG